MSEQTEASELHLSIVYCLYLCLCVYCKFTDPDCCCCSPIQTVKVTLTVDQSHFWGLSWISCLHKLSLLLSFLKVTIFVLFGGSWSHRKQKCGFVKYVLVIENPYFSTDLFLSSFCITLLFVLNTVSFGFLV